MKQEAVPITAEELRKREAALGRYMLEVRHAFNNALTSVLGNSELLLLESGALSAQARRTPDEGVTRADALVAAWPPTIGAALRRSTACLCAPSPLREGPQHLRHQVPRRESRPRPVQSPPYDHEIV